MPDDEPAAASIAAEVMAMVERCLSGALSYRLAAVTDVEPLLSQAITVIDDWPLWVTGGIPASAGSGQLEARNRVTLCRCGQSDRKPRCHGSDTEAGFRDPIPVIR